MAVTIADIRLIYTTQQSDEELEVHLEAATLIVAEALGSSPVSLARQDLITKYLAIHFATLSAQSPQGVSGALRSERLGEAEETYAVPPDSEYGFNATRWGQMALALDPTGTLAGSNASASTSTLPAQFRVIASRRCVS